MWLNYLTYVVFLLSILSLWIPAKTKIKPWQLFLCLALILAFVSHVADFIAILSILVFYCLVAFYNKCSSQLRYVLWVVVFALGLALELHIIPGFHNLLILNKIQFTEDAIPFTLYLNFDKTQSFHKVCGYG